MANVSKIGLEGFNRSEEEHRSGKVYVAMAWHGKDGATITKTTGLHDSLADAYAEAKELLNIPACNKVSDKFGDWPELPSDEINIDSEAYNTGFEAKTQGEPRKANPYQNGSWDSINWFAGWDAA